MDGLDANTITLFLLRWIHFLAGIVWIGHLWFFNLVNAHFAKTMDAETKKKVVPELMPRALYWFRWGAMFTFLSGWIYLLYKLGNETAAVGPAIAMSTTWLKWITIGAVLGTAMWFNVWFVIWPAQKKIIGWIKAGEAPPEMADTVALAGRRSRYNTLMSVPLLFCMGAASHLPTFGVVSVVAAFVLSGGVAHFFLNFAATAGKWED